MILVIDNYKTFIGRESERFKLLTENEKEEYASGNIEQIVVVKASSISFGAIKLAMENNIDIVYLGKFGHPHARIYPCKLGGTTLTRRKQLEAYNSEKGSHIAKGFITAKIKNQSSLLKSLGKARNNAELMQASKSVSKSITKIEILKGNVDQIRQQLLGIEGNASSTYFTALTKILPFNSRDKDAKDPVNISLNYGYGILYSEAERACVIAGLDPYLGFLHMDRYGKPCMTLDLVEEFRQPIVDRAVVTLFSHKQFDESYLEQNGNTVLLSQEGRKNIIEAVLGRLNQTITYDEKNISLKQVIAEQARNAARYLLGQNSEYKGFTSRW